MSNILEKYNLTGKKAMVTGGARGISYKMAEAIHDAGAEVVLIDVIDQVYESAKELGKDGAPVHAVVANLSNTEDLKKGFAEALDKLEGRVDILVNGAGIQRRYPCEDFPEDEWFNVVNINMNAVFFMCQQAGRVMLKQGYGKIINIASMNSIFGGVNIPAYSAAKGGVVMMTKTLSNEWAGKGITVNAIAPGYIVTDINKVMRSIDYLVDETNKRIPKGRWGTPDDLKGVALFLASDASEYISGSLINIDGGYSAR